MKECSRALFLSGVILFSSAGLAQAQFKVPECDRLSAWAIAGRQAEDPRQNLRPFYSGSYVFKGVLDENWVPVFGAPFETVTNQQFLALSKKAWDCRLELRKVWQKQRSAALQKKMALSEAYYTSVFRAGRRRESDILLVLNAQKKALSGYKRALKARSAQEAQLPGLKPSLESIRKVEAMKADVQLRFLGDQYAAYGQKLDRTIERFVDSMVHDAAKEMLEVPATLDGVKQMLSLRSDTKAKLGRYRSRAWNFLDETYKKSIDRVAAGAIGEFKTELASLPPTEQGIETAKKAPYALITHKPVPSNFEDFKSAAKDRIKAIRKEIAAAACRDMLATRKLSDLSDLAMLGHDGDSTLGSFVCGVENGKGYKFVEYEKPGLFSSTHTVTLERQGVSVVLDMKMAEPSGGREMLVGTRIEDASMEKELTLTEWQALAAWIVGEGMPPAYIHR